MGKFFQSDGALNMNAFSASTLKLQEPKTRIVKSVSAGKWKRKEPSAAQGMIEMNFKTFKKKRNGSQCLRPLDVGEFSAH